MDSPSPFSSSTSFLDLLNSQKQINFSEPPSQSPTTSLNPNTESLPQSGKHRWTVEEEKVLVSAWLNTSKDAIVGNEQRSGTFWSRVAAYYAASPAVANKTRRESNTCKQKWSKLNEQVQKFAGCYECASRQPKSGQNEDDVIELAHKLYLQDQKVKFGLEHAWKILKKDPKWCSQTTSKTKPMSKKTKLNDSSAYSSSSNTNIVCLEEEETMQRPMGVKAVKEKVKKGVKGKGEESEGSSLKELREIMLIKEKDHVMKEKLSNKKILENLIAKSEQLSEIEVILKNNQGNVFHLVEVCRIWTKSCCQKRRREASRYNRWFARGLVFSVHNSSCIISWFLLWLCK